MRTGTHNVSVRSNPRKASLRAGKAMCNASASFARRTPGSIELCEPGVVDSAIKASRAGKSGKFKMIDSDELNRELSERGRYIDRSGRFVGADRLARKVKTKDDRIVVTNRFTVRHGTTLYDGNSQRLGFGSGRGTIKGKVYINYGQKKTMSIDGTDEEFVYVISARTTKHPKGASGWIKKSNVRGYKRYVDTMPDLSHQAQERFIDGQRCAITGGIPDEYKNRKVVPCTSKTEKNMDARDYLKRTPDFASLYLGYVNLLYNLPGKGSVATDTLPIGTTAFVPIENVERVRVPLYRRHSCHPVSAKHPPSYMEFVYGYAKTPNADPDRRYGWIAQDALLCPGRIPDISGRGHT